MQYRTTRAAGGFFALQDNALSKSECCKRLRLSSKAGKKMICQRLAIQSHRKQDVPMLKLTVLVLKRFILLGAVIGTAVNCKSRTDRVSNMLGHSDRCDIKSDKGDHCDVDLRGVHPTQFAVGMREVDSKKKELRSHGKHSIDQEIMPIVIGPKGQIYLVDHHHAALALLSENQFNALAEVLKNWSDLSQNEFLRKMKSENLMYQYDSRGVATKESPPDSLNDLIDDPYRSLAWCVRKAGGFIKDPKKGVFFLEFKWGNFFRENHVAIGQSDEDFERACQVATKLAESTAAKGLPGYHK
ncbi:MAG: ParB/Srx family N-terminal domain-containing protein [Proteobacteria bacterium]|nr:ParB/Srx family N-terminal domain-containing protein [Pseudomonadota bacterium]